MKRLRQSHGYTLIEVMIAVAITSLLLVVIMGFTTNTLVQNSVETARSDLLREAQIALDSMAQNIRLSSNADDINRNPDANGPGGTSDLFSWTSDADTLVLATAAMDSGRNIIFEDALRYSSLKNNQIYFVQNGTLFQRTAAADHSENAAATSCPASLATPSCPKDRILIHDNVKSLTIRYLNADDNEVLIPSEARSVELTLQLGAERFGRAISISYVTRTVFRNE